MKLSFKEYKKQRDLADKLHKKFTSGKWTELDRQKWQELDITIRKIVTTGNI